MFEHGGGRVTERAALLALLRTRKEPWSEIADAVEERGSAIALLEEGGPGQLTLDTENAAPDLDDVEVEIQGWEREGMHFACLLDSDYPPQLATIHQRPPFVMWRGHANPADAQGVAIVGTRSASPEGLKTASALASALAMRGITVISGLAAGIDTAAHSGALQAGGRTVAVIGTGLRRAYPQENALLQQEIGDSGMVLSQFLPDASPTKKSFPMRNAVMSGYAAATVVVEAGWKSGARMQARLALQHGRTVLLLRSLLEHDWAREYAARPGATVVDTADDVVRLLEPLAAPAGELVWS